MPEPAAFDFPIALIAAARRNAARGREQSGYRGFVRLRVANTDAPGRAVRVRPDNGDVAPEIYHALLDAERAANLGGPIRGIFLADAAEVDLVEAS